MFGSPYGTTLMIWNPLVSMDYLFLEEVGKVISKAI